MGGTQFKYKQISEFNFKLITKTNYVVFNHDFSIVFMIQQYSIGMLLSVLQFKSGILKSISRQRTYKNQEQLLAFKNYSLFLKTCRYKGGILLNPITAQNNNKYLMRLKIKTRSDEISKTISCLIMNKNDNLIVSGGHIFNGQKRAYIEFWSSQNGWRIISQLNNSDIDISNIKSISFNQSETKIITYVKIWYQYYIIIYQYEKSNQFLVEQSKFNMMFFNQFQYINDNILIVKQQRPKSNIFGNYRLQDVLASYVLNKLNGQFDQRMQIDDEESLGQTDYITLVYSPNKQILVSMSEGLLKLIKIKDDGKLSIQQIINLEFNYDYLSISQDLKYFVICQKQLMRIFQLVEQ